MRWQDGLILATSLCLLAGCGSTAPSMAPVSYPKLGGNWQIQTSAPPTTAQPSGILLLGALQNSGATVTGTFRFSNLAQPSSCGLEQVITVSGTTDAAGNVAMTSATLPNGSKVKANLLVPAILTNSATGTIEVTGTTCALASAPAIALQIAPVTGTFRGAVTPGTIGVPGTGTGGTASLALNQSSTPAADGQFPVTGTLAYTFGTCTGSVALSGDASGVGVMLNAEPTAPESVPPVSFLGFSSPPAGSIKVGNLTFFPDPCGGGTTFASYTGTLTRQ